MSLMLVQTQILVWQTCIAGRFLLMLRAAQPVQQVNSTIVYHISISDLVAFEIFLLRLEKYIFA